METKYPIFKRVPPGDRWTTYEGKSNVIHPTLTNALEEFFQKNGDRLYYIDAMKGIIYRVVEEPDPVPEPQRFSIYGDGY